jgi:hypothetical protein
MVQSFQPISIANRTKPQMMHHVMTSPAMAHHVRRRMHPTTWRLVKCAALAGAVLSSGKLKTKRMDAIWSQHSDFEIPGGRRRDRSALSTVAFNLNAILRISRRCKGLPVPASSSLGAQVMSFWTKTASHRQNRSGPKLKSRLSAPTTWAAPQSDKTITLLLV